MHALSSDQRVKLEHYATLLKKWNEKINLVSRETILDLWERHILDSVQLAELIPENAKNLVDLGSGAGLPGLVLAIMLPTISVTLVERDQRKCAFLTEAVRQLMLPNVTIRNVDIATITERYAVITARALAPLNALCTLAYPLCEETSICYFPKGKNAATELAEAKRHWAFQCQSLASKTNDLSVILSLSNLSPLT